MDTTVCCNIQEMKRRDDLFASHTSLHSDKTLRLPQSQRTRIISFFVQGKLL